MTPTASPQSRSLSLSAYFNMPPQPAQLQHQLQLQHLQQQQPPNPPHQPRMQLQPQHSVEEIAEALRVSIPITAENAADFCCNWTPAAVVSLRHESAASTRSPLIATAVVTRSIAAAVSTTAMSGTAAAAAAGTAATLQLFDRIEAHQQLLSSGADPLRATAAWVGNQYRWVVWKLAAYQRRYTHVCGSFPLSAENIMAQIKRRYSVMGRCQNTTRAKSVSNTVGNSTIFKTMQLSSSQQQRMRSQPTV